MAYNDVEKQVAGFIRQHRRSKLHFGIRGEIVLHTLALIACLMFAADKQLMADNINWNASTDDWFNASDWNDTTTLDSHGNPTNQVPGSNDAANVTNGGAPHISGGSAGTYRLDIDGGSSLTLSNGSFFSGGGNEVVGDNGQGLFIQSGGTNTANGNPGISPLLLGYAVGSNGTYKLSGGTLTVTTASAPLYAEILGWSGSGTFNQSGGTHNVDRLLLGLTSSGIGTYVLSSGTLNVTSGDASYYSEMIGNGGNGTFTQTGGTHNVLTPGWSLVIAFSASTSHGSYSFVSGNLNASEENIGMDGVGVFDQSGGNNSVSAVGSTTGWVWLGRNGGSSGTYNLHSGSITAAGAIIGSAGTGMFNQDGGSVTINTGGKVSLGYSTSGTGTYTLTSGILTTHGKEYIGDNYSGVFIQTGGTNQTDNISLAYASTGIGSYNLSGNGVMSVTANEYVGDNGTGAFTQSGGTHTIGADLNIGQNSTGVGAYSLSNGSLTVNGNEYIGYSGTGTFTQTGGTNTVTNGSVTLVANQGASGTYSLQGGSLNANSLIVNKGGAFNLKGASPTTSLTVQNLFNSGIFSVAGNGNFTGTPVQAANYFQQATGTFQTEIDGPGVNQFGQLNAGSASLAGKLSVTLGGNYGTVNQPANTVNLPSYSDSYQVLYAGSVTGTFSSPGKYMEASFSPTVDPYKNNGGAGLFAINYVNVGSGTSVTLSNFHQVDYLGIGVNFTGLSGTSAPLRGDTDVTTMGSLLYHQTEMEIKLSATNSAANNASVIQQDFNQFNSHFNNGVGANDTIVVELSSHGNVANDGTGVFQISGGATISASAIANYIKLLPPTAQKIVLIDCCYSGSFISSFAGIQNTAILTSDTNGFSSTAPDGSGTGLFSDAIEHELSSGVYNLGAIQSFLTSAYKTGNGFGGNLIGQTLDLRATGSAVFNGMTPSLSESSGFNADLVGTSISVPEPGEWALLGIGWLAILLRRWHKC